MKSEFDSIIQKELLDKIIELHFDKHKGKDVEIDKIVSHLSTNLLEGNFTEGNIGNEIEIS